MKLKTYLSKGNNKYPKSGTVGKETEWMVVDRLTVRSGVLWIGDPEFAWAEINPGDGCKVNLPSGSYVVEAKGMDFGGPRLVSRMRACLEGSENLKTGKEVGEAGTDTGQMGVADPALLKTALGQAFGDNEGAILEALEDSFDDKCGTYRPKRGADGCIIFLPSGFGDGGGPVRELKSGRRRVGIETEFMTSNEAP